jgi:hypothetical protein
VNVTVKNINKPPVAETGPDQRVREESSVRLDGSHSYDPDGDAITYAWLQTSGMPVVLSDTSAAQPSFIAPLVGRVGETLAFELTVSDSVETATNTVRVFVEDLNHAPRADAGADQTRNERSEITLDGRGSADPDGDVVTYHWEQVLGPAVTLSSANSTTPTFTAPSVAPGGTKLVFRLIVNDGLTDSAPDDVTITVLDVADPPACQVARPNPAILWPPDHKLMKVAIEGLSKSLSIRIMGVTQDEPVDGAGDGDTRPDAVIQGETVLVRAERSGLGTGRVYEIRFIVTDDRGGSCMGSVKVGVPKSQKPGEQIVDDGQRYESTRR